MVGARISGRVFFSKEHQRIFFKILKNLRPFPSLYTGESGALVFPPQLEDMDTQALLMRTF